MKHLNFTKVCFFASFFCINLQKVFVGCCDYKMQLQQPTFLFYNKQPKWNVILIGDEISNVRIMARHGTSTNFCDAKQFAEKYGGDISLWEKKGGIVKTDNFICDIHWNEYNGAMYETKIKEIRRQK